MRRSLHRILEAPSFRGSNGFSLVEMVTVLALFGVVSVLGAISFDSMVSGSKPRNAAMEVYSDLQLARARAISENVPYVLEFDTNDNSYSIYADRDNDFETAGGESNELVKDQVDIDERHTGIQFGTVESGALTSGVTFDTSAAPGNPQRVIFTPTGLEIGNGGEIGVIPTVDAMESPPVEDNQYRVAVTRTGMIKVQKYFDGSWQ